MSFLLSFLVACLVTLAFEQFAEHAIEAGDPRKPAPAATLLDMAGVYQRIVASWDRPDRPAHTAIVEIDGRTAGIGDACARRSRLAATLAALAPLKPSVIVVDEYLSEPCDGNPAPTRLLAGTLREIAPFVPVVVGRRIGKEMTRPVDPDEDAVPILEKMEESLVVPEALPAIANLDVDNRKAPLGWFVLDPNTGREGWMGSLALVGAEAFRKDFLQANPRLVQLKSGDAIRNPYVSFLSRDQFDASARVLASALLCERRPEPDCFRAREEAARRLGGRVVVVGEESDVVDTHLSTVGPVPGFVLQANYVEALLTGRYFSPAPRWAEYVVGFVVFLLLQVVVAASHPSIAGATGMRLVFAFARALGWMALVVLATLLGLYLTVVGLRVLVNPLALGAMAIVFKVSDLIFLAIHKGGGHHEMDGTGMPVEVAAGHPPADDPPGHAG